ncbi:MAG TPA: NAD(P)H-dependent oxidoreductase subunit E [Candidatus Tumulicola sp.]|nr:NAD(P)H-dependent oxidoreductase subunit E [Candidatus Tumulicola sp.]
MTQREQDFPALLERLRPQCDEIIARYERKRSALLMLAHVFQEREGFVSPEAMRAISDMLEITQAETEGTITFYTLLFQRPVGQYVLQPCRGLACAINGAGETMDHFRERLGIGSLETTSDGLFSYEEVECLAACDRAPCMQVNLEFVYDLTPAAIDEMLEAMRAGAYPIRPLPQTDAPGRTWKLGQDEQIAFGAKAKGAIGVENPNNAGGVGDRSGTIMLDHIVNRDVAFFERTRERAVVDTRGIVESEREAERAGH